MRLANNVMRCSFLLGLINNCHDSLVFPRWSSADKTQYRFRNTLLEKKKKKIRKYCLYDVFDLRSVVIEPKNIRGQTFRRTCPVPRRDANKPKSTAVSRCLHLYIPTWVMIRWRLREQASRRYAGEFVFYAGLCYRVTANLITRGYYYCSWSGRAVSAHTSYQWPVPVILGNSKKINKYLPTFFTRAANVGARENFQNQSSRSSISIEFKLWERIYTRRIWNM